MSDSSCSSPTNTRVVLKRLALVAPPLLCLLLGGWQTRFMDPPRFDGAGYAVLAEALRTGRGYHAIDHPDSPPHAHFPPGYPLTLATVWTLAGGPSFPAAHGLSLACSTIAVALFARWLLGRAAPAVTGLLATALAVNWAWTRQAGSIQSEPLFSLLAMAALLLADRRPTRRPIAQGLELGVILVACVLTRHVGVMLAAAVLLDGLLRRRFRSTATTAAALLIGLLPWLAWQAWVGKGTQLALVPRAGLLELVRDQGVFYLGRIPDLLIGPFVEVGTVFRPQYRELALLWASLATGVILAGLIACVRRPSWRLAGLVSLLTLTLLLVWPFTEAGRFLIPLVPFLILAAWRGLRIPFGTGRARVAVAALLVVASVPYTAYSILTRRTEMEARRHADFDAACRWIARQPKDDATSGPVLSRQGGEVFWLTGRARTAVDPPTDATAQTIDRLIDTHGVAYLILDDDRYARAADSPLAAYVEERPERLNEVFRGASIVVYQVRPPASG